LAPEAVVVGDFDGDGEVDVATADNLDETITIQFGNGDGTFSNAQALVAIGEPLGMTVADLDNDGIQDLVVTLTTGGIEGSGSIRILEGLGGGVFDILPEIESDTFFFPVAVEVGDLDGDGNGDLVVVNDEGDSISVLVGNGDFTFAQGDDYSAGSFPEALTLADFDGDGSLDVAVAAFFDDTVNVFLGAGDGSLEPAPIGFEVGAGPRGLIAADVNADGRADLLAANNDDGTVSVLLNETGGGATPTPTPPLPTPTPTSPGGVCVGDCSGDGAVTVDEILTMVNIALGSLSVGTCAAGDSNADGEVTVDEILTAVNNALSGCG